jgi:hypothetical protein
LVVAFSYVCRVPLSFCKRNITDSYLIIKKYWLGNTRKKAGSGTWITDITANDEENWFCYLWYGLFFYLPKYLRLLLSRILCTVTSNTTKLSELTLCCSVTCSSNYKTMRKQPLAESAQPVESYTFIIRGMQLFCFVRLKVPIFRV